MKHLLINAVIVLAFVSVLPSPSEVFAVVSLVAFHLARHYYGKGGRWSDDYNRSVVNPSYFGKQDKRVYMEGVCLKYRIAVIASVLCATAAFVWCFK